MSFELILPFFPEEVRRLLVDRTISDLMINGTTGIYADRNGVIEPVPLKVPFTNERLQAAVERVARILGQDLTTQNPILNTRLPDGSRVAVVGRRDGINCFLLREQLGDKCRNEVIVGALNRPATRTKLPREEV